MGRESDRRLEGLVFPYCQGYYDRIIRNERKLSAIRGYIADNPISWELDRDNPARPSTENRQERQRYGTRRTSDRGALDGHRAG